MLTYCMGYLWLQVLEFAHLLCSPMSLAFGFKFGIQMLSDSKHFQLIAIWIDLGSSPDCHDPWIRFDQASYFQSTIHKLIPFRLFDYEASRTTGQKKYNCYSTPNPVYCWIYLSCCLVQFQSEIEWYSEETTALISKKKKFTQSSKTQAPHSEEASSTVSLPG